MASLHCCAHWMRRHEKFVSYIFKNVLALAHLLGATSCEALSYFHQNLMLRYFLYLMLRPKNFSCIFINVESFTSCCIMNYIKFDCSLNEKNFFCTDCQDPTSKFDNLSSEFHNFTSQFHNTISKFHNSSFTIRPSSFGIRPQSFTIRVSESVLHFSQSTSTNSSTAAFLGSWVLTRATCTFRAQFPFLICAYRFGFVQSCGWVSVAIPSPLAPLPCTCACVPEL
jgi:hypothetical protein